MRDSKQVAEDSREPAHPDLQSAGSGTEPSLQSPSSAPPDPRRAASHPKKSAPDHMLPASNEAETPRLVAPSASSGYEATIDGQPPQALVETEFRSLERWERYEILGLLGKGGMGVVYKARDRKLGRIVALKFIRGDDAVLVKRLKQEARAQASIEHPHICKVYEVGEYSGQAYIAMQFIDGPPLSLAYREMTLPARVLTLTLIAEAVHAAHRQGIIHRDLKPSNVIVERTAEGRWVPYVLDFGVAHDSNAGHSLTQTGALLGTPQYMSPEQARSDTKNIDRRSDVYSLGAMLYELLTGVPPVQAENLTDILLQVLDVEPTPPRQVVPDLPVALETVTLKCLQKEPAARYDSAKALAEDLRRYLDDVPVQARRVSMVRKLLKKARRNKPLVAVGIALVLSLLGLATYGVKNRLDARAREQRAIQQAALAQKLGQEIKDMEWLLRSSRQLQLHDLEREKVIVRKRMSKLSQELQGYGELSSGLAHYALGRGHMALHEYPQALAELQKAIAKGYQDGEVYYALGFVLGKHYEQAMADARLSGGGDWAKKQLKEIEPKYLTPAIESLQRSRSMKVDSPHYLDGLIAFYQRDYDGALKHADMALKEAPWLYEASKLAGDVHHERALQARDSGKDDDAKREFAAAVKSFEAAAAEGHSDAEVYEGLAEAWVRQIEMAVAKELPTDEAYAAAVAASDKITAAEPGSVSGALKKAFAAMLTLQVLTYGPSASERVRKCLSAAAEVLSKQPGHPYASDANCNCYFFAAEVARQHGEDPIPNLQMGRKQLEPVIAQYPYFLWGINDLGSIISVIGNQQQLHGDENAKESLKSSLRYYAKSASLDSGYISAPLNSMMAEYSLILECKSDDELSMELRKADRYFSDCISINSQEQRCFNNYFQVYARAAQRTFLGGLDAQPRIQRALQHLVLTRQLGPKLQDAEGHAAMTYLVQARDLLRKRLSPTAALTLLDTALADCFALAPEDVLCRTLAAQALWARADWQAAQHLPFAETLTAALAKARVAAESPEISPDAWQTLAETQLRIAQSTQAGKARTLHINDGLAALQKLFSINPNHALGLITQGQLLLLRAQGEQVAAQRYQSIKDAAAALERAFTNDPFVRPMFLPILESAKALLSKP